tara:strand:- start:7599 stop:7964 length:366 start_codon:yes stop_codon:yes gene_type:complete
MSRTLILRGVEYVVVAPASSVVCLEAHQFVHAMEQGDTSPTRAYAGVIGLCCKGLRPPGLPKWDGTNAAEYGNLMADHLMGAHQLSPKVISKIVDGAGLIPLLVEGVALSKDEVQFEVKNS